MRASRHGSLKPRRAPAGVSAALFALGVLCATLAAFWQGAKNYAAAQKTFDRSAQQSAARIASQIEMLRAGLYGTRSAILAVGPEQIRRRQFQTFARSRSDVNDAPGRPGFGLVRRVAPGNEAAFVRAMRADDQPGFRLQADSAHPGARYVLQFFEPAESARPKVGFDLASLAAWRAAADTAAATGQPVLTAPVPPLAGEDAAIDALLLLLPIRAPASLAAEVENQGSPPLGWAVKTIDVDEVLQSADLVKKHMALAVHDAEVPTVELFATHPRASGPAHLQTMISLPAYGRKWQVEFAAGAEFVAALDQTPPSTVFILGCLLSAGLALAAQLLTVSSERKRELDLERARRSAIVENSGDAVIGATADGKITDWNHGAEQMFGITAEQALGRTVAALVVPDHLAREDQTTAAQPPARTGCGPPRARGPDSAERAGPRRGRTGF